MTRDDVALITAALAIARPTSDRTAKKQAADYVQAMAAWEQAAESIMLRIKSHYPRLFSPNNFLRACGVPEVSIDSGTERQRRRRA